MFNRRLLSLIVIFMATAMVWISLGYGAAALGTREAREKIARLGGLANLPTNQVRIKAINVGPGNNAVVEAQLETAFKFTQVKNEWQLTEIRLGDRQWESIALLQAALNREKEARTRADLQTLQVAVESYRRERGQLPLASNIVELTDVLSPTYLPVVLRLDAWGQPLIFEVTGSGYRLGSAGADQLPGTADDILVGKVS